MNLNVTQTQTPIGSKRKNSDTQEASEIDAKKAKDNEAGKQKVPSTVKPSTSKRPNRSYLTKNTTTHDIQVKTSDLTKNSSKSFQKKAKS